MGFFVATLVAQVLFYFGLLAYNLFTGQYADQCAPSRIRDEPIAARTSGCFSADRPLTLASSATWAGAATNFTAFHLNSTYKAQHFRRLTEGVAKRLGAGLRLQQAFYLLKGCQPIQRIECPAGTGCFYSAQWRSPHWKVETFLFSIRAPQLPRHVRSRLEDPAPLFDHYQRVIVGPVRGQLCFNEIRWGARLHPLSPTPPKRGLEQAYFLGYTLPTNLPDGVLGLI